MKYWRVSWISAQEQHWLDASRREAAEATLAQIHACLVLRGKFCNCQYERSKDAEWEWDEEEEWVSLSADSLRIIFFLNFKNGNFIIMD